MRYYYTYKITCLKGSFKDHYYIGRHVTGNLDDGYCGSGILIKKYYNIFGCEENVTYTKEIIGFYNNLNELRKAEFELIGDKYLNDEYCLNLCEGGHDKEPWNKGKKGVQQAWNKGIPASEHQKQAQSKAMKGRPSWNKGKKGIIPSNKGKHRVFDEKTQKYKYI